MCLQSSAMSYTDRGDDYQLEFSGLFKNIFCILYTVLHTKTVNSYTFFRIIMISGFAECYLHQQAVQLAITPLMKAISITIFIVQHPNSVHTIEKYSGVPQG